MWCLWLCARPHLCLACTAHLSLGTLGVQACLSLACPQSKCTPGAKTGLLSFACRVWGKTQCWCPNRVDSNFNVDTYCQVMPTPVVDGYSKEVGEASMRFFFSLA